MTGARRHWDDRYASTAPRFEVSPFLASLDDLLPRSGAALDVAGGTGGDALWLAERGLATTLVDVSDVALAAAGSEAVARGIRLTMIAADLEVEPLPPGRWEVVVCRNYLQRDLFGPMAAALAPGGMLVVEIATRRNLERHDRPRPGHLLEPGEAPSLVGALDVVVHDEGWHDDRHTARLVARRSSPGAVRRGGPVAAGGATFGPCRGG